MCKSKNTIKRHKNPALWITIFISVGSIILTYFNKTPQDLTSWSSVFELFKKAISDPYLLFSCVATTLGILMNPTTKGFLDNNGADDDV